MRICMIGKYPPIQGGVSARHYICAHALARRGHTVHVVTNAREVEPAFRLMMREADWARCERQYPGGGSVQVHWTATDHGKQHHIPWHNPFATKLASLAAEAVRQHDLELVASFYLEPYAVAGCLASHMTGVPHVVRVAGSDVGLLLSHPQLEPLYRHVFQTAAKIFVSRTLRRYLAGHGVPEDRFAGASHELFVDELSPAGPALDMDQVFAEMKALDHAPVLAAESATPPSAPPPPYIGIYGKQYQSKGTFDLLGALALLAQRGRRLSLVIMGRGPDEPQARLAFEIARLGLADSVVQLPFLPVWRVPDFIRACRAVCFLERSFGIPHAPIVPREVLACGVPLIASAEKLMLDQNLDGQMIHGYNCLAARDVRDHGELADLLAAVADDQALARAIGQRGLAASRAIESEQPFPDDIAAVFARAAGLAGDRGHGDRDRGDRDGGDRDRAADPVMAAIERQLGPIAGGDAQRRASESLLYRLHGRLDAELATGEAIATLYPAMLPEVSFVAPTEAAVPIAVVRGMGRVVATRIRPEARALVESLDGSRSIAEIADEIASGYGGDDQVRQSVQDAIVRYFELGLLSLGDRQRT